MSSILQRGKRKEIMSVNLTDYSFKTEKVEQETDSMCFCKKHDGYTPLMFKGTGPSFKGENRVRWLMVEGTPMAHWIDTEGVEAELEFIDYVKSVLGDKVFNDMPKLIKEKLVEPVGISVNIKPIETDEELDKIITKLKAKSMLRDADIDNVAQLGKGEVRKKLGEVAMQAALYLVAGIGVDRILIGLGILK